MTVDRPRHRVRVVVTPDVDNGQDLAPARAVAAEASHPAAPEEYRVGNRRPPLETRFAKGKSGNPKGRPKGARNTATLLSDKLDEKIAVRTPDGRQKKMSKREVGVTKLVNRFAETGDQKLFELVQRHEPVENRGSGSPQDTDPTADHAELSRVRQSILDWYVEARNSAQEDSHEQ